MKLYKRLVNLELNFPNTFLNAKMTYITIVDIDELYKLGIHHFSAEIIWGFKILFAVTLFFKFQNLNCSNHITQKY